MCQPSLGRSPTAIHLSMSMQKDIVFILVPWTSLNKFVTDTVDSSKDILLIVSVPLKATKYEH